MKYDSVECPLSPSIIFGTSIGYSSTGILVILASLGLVVCIGANEGASDSSCTVVGGMDGFNEKDGRDVAIVVGWVDSFSLGTEVGKKEGLSDFNSVGIDDGTVEGDSDGIVDKDGRIVGTREGLTETDGLSVG